MFEITWTTATHTYTQDFETQAEAIAEANRIPGAKIMFVPVADLPKDSDSGVIETMSGDVWHGTIVKSMSRMPKAELDFAYGIDKNGLIFNVKRGIARTGRTWLYVYN